MSPSCLKWVGRRKQQLTTTRGKKIDVKVRLVFLHDCRCVFSVFVCVFVCVMRVSLSDFGLSHQVKINSKSDVGRDVIKDGK